MGHPGDSGNARRNASRTGCVQSGTKQHFLIGFFDSSIASIFCSTTLSFILVSNAVGSLQSFAFGRSVA
eukprot:scaffold82380_cov48-Attheya_sp.AAC.1